MKFDLKSIYQYIYRISANSCRDNYSFFGLKVRQVFKGGNYSREETIFLLIFLEVYICMYITWIAVASYSFTFLMKQTCEIRINLKSHFDCFNTVKKIMYLSRIYLVDWYILLLNILYKWADLKCTLVRQLFKGDNYSREETIN